MMTKLYLLLEIKQASPHPFVCDHPQVKFSCCSMLKFIWKINKGSSWWCKFECDKTPLLLHVIVRLHELHLLTWRRCTWTHRVPVLTGSIWQQGSQANGRCERKTGNKNYSSFCGSMRCKVQTIACSFCDCGEKLHYWRYIIQTDINDWLIKSFLSHQHFNCSIESTWHIPRTTRAASLRRGKGETHLFLVPLNVVADMFSLEIYIIQKLSQTKFSFAVCKKSLKIVICKPPDIYSIWFFSILAWIVH